jgi:hypothetical protein
MLVNNPVSIALSSGNEYWKHYRSGILDRCSTGIDHGVLLVGVY